MLLRRILIVFMLTSAILKTFAQEVRPDPYAVIAWSPDGTRLGVFSKNGVFIYDHTFHLLTYRALPSANGRWSSDGTKLFVNRLVLDAETLDTLMEDDAPFHIWLNDDSQVITLGDNGREMRILDAQTGDLVKTIASPAQIEFAIPSPQGTHILVVVANTLFVFDVEQGILSGQYTFPVRSIPHYVWNGDGTRIAFSTSADASLTTPGSVHTPIMGNPNAASLYVVNVMDAISGEILFTSAPLPEPIHALTWSQHAPRLAGMSPSGSIYVWETDTLELLNTLPFSGAATYRLAYSPYGGVLAMSTSPGSSGFDELSAAQMGTSLPDGLIQLIVPEASLEYLNEIRSECASSDSLPVPQIEEHLSDYIEQISATTEEQIPAGCAADLKAVAEALMED